MTKREKLSVWFLFGAFLFWIGENWVFGWNATPKSAVEGFCDTTVLFLVAFSFVIKPSYKTEVKNTSINTKSLHFINNSNKVKFNKNKKA